MSTLRKDSGQIKVKTHYLKAVKAKNEGNCPYSTETVHKYRKKHFVCLQVLQRLLKLR